MWHPDAIRVADVEKIERAFEIAFSGKGWGPISEALRHKLPVRLGGLTDLFQKSEEETRTTLKLIRLLNRYDYPYLIVTKSDLLARPEYLEELVKGKAYVQVTVISLDEERVAKIEPGAPRITARIKAIRRLADAGLFICGRMSPAIPILSTGAPEAYVDRMAEAGARHILVEFFRGNKTMIRAVETLAGIQFMDLMEPKGSYCRANIDFKNAFYERMHDLCVARGMSFSVCSDGDLVPQRYNTTENCCGTDTIKGFEGCSTCTANAVAREVRAKGSVTLERMTRKYWSPDLDQFRTHWESGRVAELVEGIRQQGDRYVEAGAAQLFRRRAPKKATRGD